MAERIVGARMMNGNLIAARLRCIRASFKRRESTCGAGRLVLVGCKAFTRLIVLRSPLSQGQYGPRVVDGGRRSLRAPYAKRTDGWLCGASGRVCYVCGVSLLSKATLGCVRPWSLWPGSCGAPVIMPTVVATWLILPVVICLSQRLSHACLSTSLIKVKPRMAH